MNTKIKRFINQSFVKNVLVMASGTASAQLIALLVWPAITRLYGSEALGILGVFMAIVGVLSPIVALTYPISMVLPKKDSDAIGLAGLSFSITVIISFACGILILLFNERFVKLLNVEDFEPYMYCIPLVIFFSGMQQILEQWFIRKKLFELTAKVVFIQSVITQASRLGIGFLNPVASMLLLLAVLSQVLYPILLLGIKKINVIKINLFQKNQSNKKLMFNLAKEYKDFVFFRAPQTFLDSITQTLPTLLLSTFFGVSSVGFYTICRTVLSVPTTLIGKSVGDVFYPRISEAGYAGECLTDLLKKSTLYLTIIGIIPFSIVIIFGPSIFSILFGENWIQAGNYARWIALWSFSTFILSPGLRALPVLSAQSVHLKFTVTSLLIRLLALTIGYYFFASDNVAVALFGTSSAVLNFLLLFVTLKLSKEYDSKIEKNLVKSL